MIKSFISEFCEVADASPDRYRIYPIHQLFFDLKEEAAKNNVEERSGFPTINVAEAQLTRDQYVYLRNTACNYHEDIDCSKFCALSNVQRWAFTFADHICMDLNIPLIAGQHLPAEIDISHLNSTAFNESKMNDTDDTESHFSNATAASAYTEPKWKTRTPSPEHESTTSDNEDFPSLGRHPRQKAGPSKKRSDPHRRDVNNPWNNSMSSSSSDTNAWHQRRDPNASGFPKDTDFIPFSRVGGRGSDSFRNSVNSSATRGRGRGSELFQKSYFEK
jgi:hypothetical protein